MDNQDVIAELSEPIVKKAKLDEYVEMTIDNLQSKIVGSEDKLKAVMHDEFYEPIPCIQMYIGHVKNPKDMSKIITALNERLPLKEFSFLKRAFKRNVILSPVDNIDGSENRSIQDYIEKNAGEVKDDFEYFSIIDLPARAPKLRKQYLFWIKTWSCHFHTNKYLENLFSGEVFSKDALQQHRKFMAMALEVAKWHLREVYPDTLLSEKHLSSTNATIVVDPQWQRVVTATHDNRERHPVQHSAMLAIDNVAVTQNGGAWSEQGGPAIDEELLKHLISVYPTDRFGPRDSVQDDNHSKSDYLCTGFNVYTVREPCVMCAMALVHARVKRIFFCFKNSHQGALCSKTKLQCVQSLNHHFEVFTNFL